MANSNKLQVGRSHGRIVSVSFELLFLVNETHSVYQPFVVEHCIRSHGYN